MDSSTIYQGMIFLAACVGSFYLFFKGYVHRKGGKFTFMWIGIMNLVGFIVWLTGFLGLK